MMNGVPALLCTLLLCETLASVDQLQFLHNTLESVHKETFIATLLVMQRHQRRAAPDPLQPFYPLAWPTLRLDKGQRIEMVKRYRRQVVALVYIDAYEDTVLLDALAECLNNMREARIVVWLQVPLSEQLLAAICQQAAEYRFFNLLVLEGTSSAHRLQPFPRAHFHLIPQNRPLYEGPVFPIPWLNFHGRVAKTALDHIPPRSFTWEDRLTGGGQRNSGFLYNLMVTFARKRNISLSVQHGLTDGKNLTRQLEMVNMTLSGELDLPMTAQLINLRRPNQSWTNAFMGISTISIAVPCGQELGMGDLISLFVPTMMIALLLHYICYTVTESLVDAIYHRWAHRRCGFTCLNLVINLRVFRSILAMPVGGPLSHRMGSVMGQLLVMMSFSGLIGSTLLGAQLSTLLTMNPQYRYIRTLKQLRDSNLTVVFNEMGLQMITDNVDPDFLATQLPNVLVMTGKKQMELIASLNTSYAYQIFSYYRDPLWALQQHTSRKSLCKSRQLDLVRDISSSIVLQQNSLYAPAVAQFVDSVWAVGLMSHWYKQSVRDMIYASKGSHRHVPAQSAVDAAKLEDFKTLWILLAVGCALSVGVFIAELVVGRRRARTDGSQQ